MTEPMTEKCGDYPPKPWYLNQYQWEAVADRCVLPPGHARETRHNCGHEGHSTW